MSLTVLLSIVRFGLYRSSLNALRRGPDVECIEENVIIRIRNDECAIFFPNLYENGSLTIRLGFAVKIELETNAVDLVTLC